MHEEKRKLTLWVDSPLLLPRLGGSSATVLKSETLRRLNDVNLGRRVNKESKFAVQISGSIADGSLHNVRQPNWLWRSGYCGFRLHVLSHLDGDKRRHFVAHLIAAQGQTKKFCPIRWGKIAFTVRWTSVYESSSISKKPEKIARLIARWRHNFSFVLQQLISLRTVFAAF